jgi:hypothetical protein
MKARFLSIFYERISCAFNELLDTCANKFSLAPSVIIQLVFFKNPTLLTIDNSWNKSNKRSLT